MDADREEILGVHDRWWRSNTGLDIPAMRTCFPAGDAYLMFNLSGHPYFGIEEKVALWEHLEGLGLEYTDVDVQVMRLEIAGDMAWLACEAESTRRGSGEEPFHPLRIRATEVYRRDDGSGEPRWTMWHFHCSHLPPEDEARPPFGDTAEQRGLGGGPPRGAAD